MSQNKPFYKSYRRQKRILHSEPSFSLGMSYTNAPLQDGFLKTLVNYNINNRGESISPRPGMRSYALGLYRKEKILGSGPLEYNANMMISAARQCSEVNNKMYEQVILGEVSDSVISGTNLNKGKLYVGTLLGEGEAHENEDFLHENIDEEMTMRDLVFSSLANNLTTKYSSFKKPLSAEIHGVSLDTPEYISQHVGAFAFNNNYYYFIHENGEPSKFCRTSFDNTKAVEPGAYYKEAVVSAKTINPKEAVMWGYNMLLAAPYTFANASTAGIIQLLGILPYDSSGSNLIMTPIINQEITFKCFYNAATANSYTFHWEWKELLSNDWISIKSESLNMSALPTASVSFSSPSSSIMIRVTATKSGEEFPEKVMTVGFNFDKEQYGSVANISPIEYNLHRASGMSFWQKRIVLYGLSEDPTVLIMSDVNDPGYFPYPNNVEVFDESIINVIPFLDSLLVFTTSKLYLLNLSEDGLGWNSKMIQGGLHIKEWDQHLVQIIKNMVFFKSGNYYYMVVPRAGSGELTVAPISKHMEFFFDNFKNNIKEMLKTLYIYDENIQLIHYYNYLDFEDVHNVYVFSTPTNNLYINISVLYNTVSRSWRMYVHESQHLYHSLVKDVTQKGRLINLVPLNQRYYNGDSLQEIITPGIQLLKYDSKDPQDFYIPRLVKIYPEHGETDSETDDVFQKFEDVHLFKNYQFIDTGYREHTTDFKKRYRELQLKINNISGKNLYFYTDFFIDGEMRKRMYKYTSFHNIDPLDSDYGLLTIEAEFIDPSVVGGTTVLAEDTDDLNSWLLDVSGFPDISFWKIRIPVSGKGYSPRIRLISHNVLQYELLNIAWIFRPLYAR